MVCCPLNSITWDCFIKLFPSIQVLTNQPHLSIFLHTGLWMYLEGGHLILMMVITRWQDFHWLLCSFFYTYYCLKCFSMSMNTLLKNSKIPIKNPCFSVHVSISYFLKAIYSQSLNIFKALRYLWINLFLDYNCLQSYTSNALWCLPYYTIAASSIIIEIAVWWTKTGFSF